MTTEKKTSLSEKIIHETLLPLQKANKEFSRTYPGESPNRQPVHTVYGGAHLFKSNAAQKLGEVKFRGLCFLKVKFFSLLTFYDILEITSDIPS